MTMEKILLEVSFTHRKLIMDLITKIRIDKTRWVVNSSPNTRTSVTASKTITTSKVLSSFGFEGIVKSKLRINPTCTIWSGKEKSTFFLLYSIDFSSFLVFSKICYCRCSLCCLNLLKTSLIAISKASLLLPIP